MGSTHPARPTPQPTLARTLFSPDIRLSPARSGTHAATHAALNAHPCPRNYLLGPAVASLPRTGSALTRPSRHPPLNVGACCRALQPNLPASLHDGTGSFWAQPYIGRACLDVHNVSLCSFTGPAHSQLHSTAAQRRVGRCSTRRSVPQLAAVCGIHRPCAHASGAARHRRRVSAPAMPPSDRAAPCNRRFVRRAAGGVRRAGRHPWTDRLCAAARAGQRSSMAIALRALNLPRVSRHVRAPKYHMPGSPLICSPPAGRCAGSVTSSV